MSDYLGMNSDFGYSTQTTIDQMMYFDPYRLPDLETAPEGLIGHLFMSRPSLNLSGSNIDFLRTNTKTAIFFNDPVARAAMESLSTRSKSRWIPLIYKKAKSYNVNDMEIKSIEKGGTYFGHTMRYGIHSEESKYGGTFSIDFRNDKDHSILWMMYFWMTYIHLVSSERNFTPDRTHMVNGVLDYAASLYYLVTDRTGKKIVYFEKLLGVFPVKSPMSIFSWNDDIFTKDEISIEFNFAFRSDPMDYDILVDFMFVSGLADSKGIAKLKKSDIIPLGGRGDGAAADYIRKDRMVTVPVIYRRSNTAGSDFCLGWSNTGTGQWFYKTGYVSYNGSSIPSSEGEVNNTRRK